MELVLLTALGVGGATVIGSLIGFIFKNISHKFSDIILSFAAGVMLAAAVLGLIVPSLEYGGKYGILITVAGIFVGAVCLNLIDKLVPHLHKFVGDEPEAHHNANLSKVLLFVLAIAIHNLPEGIAAGVGFGSGDTTQALIIAGGIALQNIPEGMVIIAPMLAAGIRSGKTFILAMITGLVEVVGTLIGYFCRQYIHSDFALRACICGRNDALRHQRRNDTRNPRTRERARCDLCFAYRLLRHACHGCVVGIEEKRQDFCNGFPGAFLITPFTSHVRSPFRKEWIFYLVLSPDAPHRRSGSRLQSCSSLNRCLQEFGLQYSFSDRFDR